jgi:hypothetical protein
MVETYIEKIKAAFYNPLLIWGLDNRVMVFNATFNSISVILLWQSVLLAEKTRVPGENYRHTASH